MTSEADLDGFYMSGMRELWGYCDSLDERWEALLTHLGRLGTSVDRLDELRRLELPPDGEQILLGVAERELAALEADNVKEGLKGDRGSPRWKAAIAHDRRSVRRVAEDWGVSVGTVSAYRKAFGVMPRGQGRPRKDGFDQPDKAQSIHLLFR